MVNMANKTGNLRRINIEHQQELRKQENWKLKAVTMHEEHTEP